MSLWDELAKGSYKLHYYQAEDIKTRCLEAGEDNAEAVVFLHGTGGHLEAFYRNILPHAAHYHTFAIDMIGHGFTDKPDKHYEIKDYVKHLIDFCDVAKLDKIHLHGESLGGWIAAQFAIDHPDRIGKLILNTAGGLVTNVEALARLIALSRKAVAEPNRENIRKRLEFLMKDPAMVSDDLVEMRYQIYLQPDFPQAMENILCLQDPEIRPRNMLNDKKLRQIQAKTLVLWTTHDPTAPASVGEHCTAMIPDSEFVVMKDCGHWAQYEDAPTFNKIHLDFLAK